MSNNEVEDDFGLISLFEPSTAVALPLAKNVDDSFEISSSDNEPDDSPLKEIYSEQTFTSFDLLEKYLKCYFIWIGFKTKIVRVEKENNVIAHKTYKCHHEATILMDKNPVMQLQSGIELRLKDEVKYAKFQEFQNMNSTTDLLYISNTIFKRIDDLYKKYLTPNLLALQQKQIIEYLLYRLVLHNS
ncbi:17086_t:CDS:2 [Gigaspora rosea]|nr:17086_t:CDS:2 [Gigaspora rosea]